MRDGGRLVPTLDDVRVEQLAPRTAVAAFAGEHDVATKDAVKELLGSLLARNELVIADFTDAQFVDAAILEVLLQADREAQGHGSTFRLQLGTAPIVDLVFEIAGISDVLDCAATREEALARGSR